MVIGDKLARGLANNTVLDIALRGAKIWKRLTSELDNFPTPPSTPKGARKFLNHVQRHIEALSLMSFRSESGRSGPATTWFYFDIPDPNDLSEFCITKSILAPLKIQSNLRERLVFFSHHALARLHQRASGIDWKLIEGEFRAAILYINVLKMILSNGVPLKQFFLPGLCGVFAGVVEQDGKLRITTYIGKSNMSKRWIDALDMFEKVKNNFPKKDILGRCFADRLLAGDLKTTNEVAGLIANMFGSERYCWVMEPYKGRDDPVGDAWTQALARRDDETQLPRN